MKHQMPMAGTTLHPYTAKKCSSEPRSMKEYMSVGTYLRDADYHQVAIAKNEYSMIE